MRLTSSRNRLIEYTLVFVVGVLVGQIVPVVWKGAVIYITQSSYQEATYRCDRSMRDHLLAKQNVDAAPSEQTVRALKASEIALIDCQDYDMFRKQLILLGLDENALGLMALKAIEAKAKDLQGVIEIHEIRY